MNLMNLVLHGTDHICLALWDDVYTRPVCYRHYPNAKMCARALPIHIYSAHDLRTTEIDRASYIYIMDVQYLPQHSLEREMRIYYLPPEKNDLQYEIVRIVHFQWCVPRKIYFIQWGSDLICHGAKIVLRSCRSCKNQPYSSLITAFQSSSLRAQSVRQKL